MVEILNMELDKARQRVHRAQLALEVAEGMLEGECGLAINVALCCRIRAAQRCVAEAKERVTRIHRANATGRRPGAPRKRRTSHLQG